MQLNGFMVAFKDISWSVTLFIVIYHILLLVLLPIYLISTIPSFGLLISTVMLMIICGLSITAGYHRFYSHRAYSLHKIPEAFLLFFGTMSAQTSALRWSAYHRVHHSHSDTEQDPYSVKHGFWHAHIFWLFRTKEPRYNVVKDLQKNKLVMFQHNHYVPLLIFTNLIAVLFFGWLFQDYFGAFVFIFLVRLFINNHTTWFVNSLAHTWGAKPYSREHTSVNNFIVAILTHGEGYHNYHHVFPSDYRNGVRWYQWDPTKIFIWMLHKVGLAKGLRKANLYAMRKRLVLEDKKQLLKKTFGKEELQRKIMVLAERLNEKLGEINKPIRDYKLMKQEKMRKEIMTALKFRIKNLKRSLRNDFRSWNHLCNEILYQKA